MGQEQAWIITLILMAAIIAPFIHVARHSGADRVEILIDNSESVFRMEISDNGTGFDPQSVKGGNGLKNMKMRAGRIGAALDIRNGTGCVIRLEMKGL